jgi:hypothetical protein
MPQGFDDYFILIEQEGIGVFACELELEGDHFVLVGTFGGDFDAEDTVVLRYVYLQYPACGKQGMQQGIEGGVVALKRTLAWGFVDEAVAACHVEEVALMLVKDQFEGIVLHTSGTGDEGEVVEAFGDGLKFI